ncbi:LysR family transcriptional regulator [Reyranella sp.]|uniref:LysR family transcriptional regulator n=1 Tax=Reyranella sp. TaxID=1929291 RepID=UPI003BA9FCC2
MDMDLKLLEHAVVLAKHRHFGRAAAALRISQPTLSRNIAALEKRLGLRVFERSRRDVVATPAGDDFLRMADELVARAAVLSSQLQQVRDGRAGRLRVAAGAFIHDIAVQPAAIELIRSHPDIRLELLEREWTAVLALLMTDQIDFAVFDVGSLGRMPSLRTDPLAVLHGVHFCRTGHPLLRKARLQADDLRRYPFAMPAVAQQHLGMIGGFDAGLTVDRGAGSILASIAVSPFHSARDFVAETDAISVGHMSQIAADVAAGRLAVLDTSGLAPRPVVKMGIAYKRDRTLPPAARLLLSLIRKRTREAARLE